MLRPQTHGATAAGKTKRWATQQSPRRQTAMMACHFTAGRCTDALIPVLGLDALMPAAPFKCSLLDTLGTSPTSSSLLPPRMSSRAMDPSTSSTTAGSASSGVKRRGRPRAAGTKRRFPPCGHPEPEAPCALGRRRRVRRTMPPQGPPWL
jgi:hypothetical protein